MRPKSPGVASGSSGVALWLVRISEVSEVSEVDPGNSRMISNCD